MADKSENPTQLNFSIQDTMDLGMGNAQLIDDLFEPESSTGDPDKIEKLEEEPAVISPKENKKVKTPPAKQEPKELEKEEVPQQSVISNFLEEKEEEEKSKEPAKNTNKSEEEEEEEEEGKEKEVDETTSQLSLLAKDLEKLGVFRKEEGEETIEIKTSQEFLDRFNSEKKKGAMEIVDNFIGQFGQDYQNAFDAIFVNGVNPKDYFNTYNTIVNFAELDMSVEENQINVIKQTLSDQGFEPEDITTEVERLKNYGDLQSVATKYHKVLVKKETIKLQQLEQESQQQLQRKAALKNQYIQNVQSVLQEKLKAKAFDGIPINMKLANELQDFLLVDKYKTGSGELLTEFDRTVLDLKKPENHEKKVKVGLLLKLLEKDPTLSTIQRSGITKKSDELFGQLAQYKVKSKPSQSMEANKSSFQGL
jgi:hypothetical protein